MSFILLKNSLEKEAQVAETLCPAAWDFFPSFVYIFLYLKLTYIQVFLLIGFWFWKC